MSEKTKITQQLIEGINTSINQSEPKKLKKILSNLHIADVAEILEKYPPEVKM